MSYPFNLLACNICSAKWRLRPEAKSAQNCTASVGQNLKFCATLARYVSKVVCNLWNPSRPWLIKHILSVVVNCRKSFQMRIYLTFIVQLHAAFLVSQEVHIILKVLIWHCPRQGLPWHDCSTDLQHYYCMTTVSSDLGWCTCGRLSPYNINIQHKLPL